MFMLYIRSPLPNSWGRAAATSLAVVGCARRLLVRESNFIRGLDSLRG